MLVLMLDQDLPEEGSSKININNRFKYLIII